MNSPGPMPFFDGHNDALLRLLKREGADAPRAFLDGEGKGQLDLPMARPGRIRRRHVRDLRALAQEPA